MKPKINLASPITKLGISYYNSQVKKALELEDNVEKGVIPIASVPPTKAHQKPKVKPEQIGSGVLINIKDQYFVFSATHVFVNFEGNALITSPPGRNQIEVLAGERYSTGSFNTKVDKFDATVFHIQSQMSDKLKEIAISLDDIDFDTDRSVKSIHMITGFLVKDSNTSGNEMKSKAKNFPTIELDNYDEYGYDLDNQILLAYEDQVLAGNQWQTSPIPRGMSGGAIIKAQGTSLSFQELGEGKTEKQLLSGITIEHHRDKGRKKGFVLGTRINVFLGLIYQFYPNILDEFLTT